jgi:alpha-tubulin suppressor-like RCC1 family protein
LSDVYHTRFGITQDGTLYAWGHNANGQIGDGSITSRSSPVAVAGTLKFTDIGSGGIAVGTASAAVGVSTDGAIYAWGTGINGQLGNNTVNSASSPTLVLGGRRVSQDLQVPKVLVDVTPGQSYAIVVNAYFASFGGVAVGRLLKGIVLEY